MPKMQVYLTDDLYDAVKTLGLPASQMLQAAVQAEVTRRKLVADAWDYVAEVEAEVGKPGQAELEEARAWARRLAERQDRAAG